jgi:transglutaminase-like putative cysteine protease
MKLGINVTLDYSFPAITDILLQIEMAHLPEQSVSNATLWVSDYSHFAREPAQDGIGERILMQVGGHFSARYDATVDICRNLADVSTLDAVPVHRLPGETVPYLLDSLYCPGNEFRTFVDRRFGALSGGRRIAAIQDYIHRSVAYDGFMSTPATTARDTFVHRTGICRDFAHLFITFARASSIPARFASVYAPSVSPSDFHAVAEVFLDNEWHLVDATGMAVEGEMAKIGIGRDAADVAILTSFGQAEHLNHMVTVTRL